MPDAIPTIALCAMALAVAYRERGAAHSWLGTQGARLLFWGLPVGLVVLVLTGSPWLAAQGGAAAFVGVWLLPHGAGHNLAVPWSGPVVDGLQGINLAERIGYLAAVGIARLTLIALPLVPSYPAALYLPLAGALSPLGYLIGLYLPALPWRLRVATEWGEALTGLAFGAALAAVLTV